MSLVILLVAAFLSVQQPPVAQVGAPLPDWQEGLLDIHAVNTGRGECTFIIYPDGTTLLVDAGDLLGYKPSKYESVPARPSDEEEPWQVYADYILHFHGKKFQPMNANWALIPSVTKSSRFEAAQESLQLIDAFMEE